MSPVSPHPVTITVNNDQGSALENARVFVRNTTKKTETEESFTNSSGQVIIDLADLPLADGQSNEYDDGDETLIIAYKGQSHDAAQYTVTGSSKSQTLQMNPVRFMGGTENHRVDSVKLISLLGANTTSTVYYAKVYAIGDGELLAHLEVPANDSRSHYFSPNGEGCARGFVIERENTGLVVTATTK